MPELPDLTIYIEALEARLLGATLTGMRLASPFVLRTAEPTFDDMAQRIVKGVSRIGKRVVLRLEGERFIVIHLMIAGRFRWVERGRKLPGKLGLVAFDFSTGTLILTEASQKRRASVFFAAGTDALSAFDLGGIEVLEADLAEFRRSLERENHTLKRSMTDQRFLAGIGNAYSDEILHHARLSPMRQIRHLNDDEWQRLFASTQRVLADWVEILRDKAGTKFPAKVTAFHDEMAVHGKYRQPCPDCGAPVQRIRYASNECNYCAACQNQGKLLADRSLSRLLKKDWPKTLEELDQVSTQ